MSASLPLFSRPSLKTNPNSLYPRLSYSPSLVSVRFPPPKPCPTRLLLGFSPRSGGGVLVCAARNGGRETDSEVSAENEADEARGQSTMPERFRHLTKEVPERPVRWPLLLVLVFIVYAWRTVLWELTNWKKALFAIIHFLGYLSKLALAFIFHFIGDPITAIIRYIEFSFYFVRSIYASIVAFAPVPELTWIILLTSIVLSIAEATSPDSVNSQPYLLTAAGLIGFGAVRGFIPELLFWFLLSGLFIYSWFVKKRDVVSAVLPSVSVLIAVGEPWVRGLVMATYLALAIIQHSKPPEENTKAEIPASGRRLPVPLLLAALAVGIHVAAKWIRYRHLTWMIA